MIKNILQKLRLFSFPRKGPHSSLSSLLGFNPRNLDYYELALTHKSSAIRNQDGSLLNNERLEFLGDSILDAVVADILYHKYDKKPEGYLTNTRSKIVQRETLNDIALKIGLDKYMHISENVLQQKNNIYGNAFEALIGAIYLDYGFDKAKLFLQTKVFKQYINIEKLALKEVNFKSRLIEWSQKTKVDVVFHLIEEQLGADNTPLFKTQILINNVEAGMGTGRSKRESQQQASKYTLKKIKSSPNFYLPTQNTSAVDDSTQ